MFYEKFLNRYRQSRYSSEKGAFKLLSGVLIPDEWARYSTQQATDFEVVHRPIWDTQTYVDNSTVLLNFFAAAQANPGLGNEVFPLKNSYLAASIGVYFKDEPQSDNLSANGTAYASRFDDHVLLVNTGVLNITIGQKLYGPFPLWKLSPGAGVWGLFTTTGTPSGGALAGASYSQLGLPSPEAMFKLAIPLVIPMNTSTVVTMAWASAVNLTGNSSICLCLDGKEARPLQ